MIEAYVKSEMRDFDELIGLNSVKEEIERLVTDLVHERNHRAMDVSIFPARRHLVFSGPPGVGKRKVAHAFGQICRRLGALDKGHVVVVNQADIAATSVDDKLWLMREKCDAAVDGILYIRNEAFLTAGILRSTGDLRLDAVDVMIEFMNRYRGRISVILDARLNQLHYISFHSVLARRFTTTIDFPAYDAFELLQILAVKADRLGIALPTEIENDLLPWIASHSHRSDWRNADEIVDLFSKALGARAMRSLHERHADLGGFDRNDFRQALLAKQSNQTVSAGRSVEISSALSPPLTT
jgi:hypothetical protein